MRGGVYQTHCDSEEIQICIALWVIFTGVVLAQPLTCAVFPWYLPGCLHWIGLRCKNLEIRHWISCVRCAFRRNSLLLKGVCHEGFLMTTRKLFAHFFLQRKLLERNRVRFGKRVEVFVLQQVLFCLLQDLFCIEAWISLDVVLLDLFNDSILSPCRRNFHRADLYWLQSVSGLVSLVHIFLNFRGI